MQSETEKEELHDALRQDWTAEEIEPDARLAHARGEMLFTFCFYAGYVALMFVVMYALSAEDRGTSFYLFGLPGYLAAVCLIALGAVATSSFAAAKLLSVAKKKADQWADDVQFGRGL